ncbi:DNA repair protein RadC [Enterococcus faecalis]|nr:DNA repair protein RadC [Enterococcus faecalis]
MNNQETMQVYKIEQKKVYEKEKIKITSSIKLANFCKEKIGNNASEALLVICLDTKNNIIAYTEMFKGTLNSSIAHPREIYMFALLNNSARIALSHNHPSEDITPSKQDNYMTERMREVGEIIGIELLDHIIVSREEEYYSYREESKLM